MIDLAYKHCRVKIDTFGPSLFVRMSVRPKTHNVSMLAKKFGANTGRLVLVVLLFTALAFLSFSAEWLF